MKKVCILQNGLAKGGTDTFVIELCKHLDKTKYDITVVNSSDKQCEINREKELNASGVKIIRTYPLDGFKSKFLHLQCLYKILKSGNFDIFQTNIDLFNGPNLFIAWLAGVPTRICHSHNSNQNKAISGNISLVNKLYQRTMRWLCWTFSNKHCGCSDLANEFLYKGHKWENSTYPTIIYNPVDLEKFRGRIDVVLKKKELGLSNSKKYLLTVGRFINQKNPLLIVEILKELFGIRHDIDIIWLGEGGDLEKTVKEKISEHHIADRIHFLGARNDVNEIMHCVDLFILPSNFEGLGIVLIEAQATGKPCIASNTIPKISSCGGVEFLPIDKMSISLWVKTIIDIVDGKRILKIERTELEKFSAINTARQMETVFES